MMGDGGDLESDLGEEKPKKKLSKKSNKYKSMSTKESEPEEEV
jgi:hypothetical protein